jgi:DNA-directed RNA polymerase sigma subunit (sigma70/sigma32)
MSIEFKDYQKLVSQQAWKALTRLHALGIHSMDFDDVYQEMCLYYTIALKTFDASKGFVFSTYVVTVMQRRFQRVVTDLVEERGHMTSVEEIEARTSSEDGFSLYEHVSTDAPSIEDAIAHKIETVAKLEKLSTGAKMILMELINPSAELEEEFNAKQAHVRFGRELGVANGRISSDLSLHHICEHYGISGAARRQLRSELKDNFGVEV